MLQRIGKYEILDRIGRGGQGTVYRARDTGLDRIVAIKVINQPLPNGMPRRSRRGLIISIGKIPYLKQGFSRYSYQLPS